MTTLSSLVYTDVQLANVTNLQVTTAASFGQANLAFSQANAAFLAANNAVTDFSPAFNQANIAFAAANTKLSSSGGTISGDLSITGNLFVSGNATIFTANNLVINDPIVLMANNNTADVQDLGFVAHYDTDLHTGFIRSASTKEWYLFKNYDAHFFYNGQGNIDLSGNNFTLDTINTNVRTSNLILGGANAILTIDGAFSKANSALANTSGVSFNGTLNFPTGNVGIGTSNPSNTLHVIGTANISGTLKSAGLYDSSNRLLLIKNSAGTVVWGN